LKSRKAAGPDGIQNIVLKNLPVMALRYLATLRGWLAELTRESKANAGTERQRKGSMEYQTQKIKSL
jgi:hypothetical protein